MKKTIWVLGLLLLIVASAVGVGAQDGKGAHTFDGDTLNVRSGPGVGHEVVGVLNPGTPVTLTGEREGAWVTIKAGEVEGWVNGNFLVFPAGTDAPIDNPEDDFEPDGNRAITTLGIYLRRGPGTEYERQGIVVKGTVLILEARDFSDYWFLAHTEDGNTRGWFAKRYMNYDETLTLPVSDEILEASVAFVEDAKGPDAPIVPYIGPRVREIFLAGQAMGNHPDSVTTVGDCATAGPRFLYVIDPESFETEELRETARYFAGSFTHASLAAETGLNTIKLLDPNYADPSICNAGETMLACEYRIAKPTISLIMLGTMDVHALSAAQFEAHMRAVVDISIAHGVIPVLSTIPDQPEMASTVTPSHEINAVIAQVASDYGVPLWNFWRAAHSLTNYGLRENDLTHLNAEGFLVRNRTAIMVLDVIRREAMLSE